MTQSFAPNKLLAISVILSASVSIAVASTIYVDADATGANDGSSWGDAYNYLQDALADANSAEKPVEIRVAQGIYRPDQGAGITPGDREASFQLINGVAIKGSYAGLSEPGPDARDIDLYKTILSGDLAGDDVPVLDPADLLEEPTRAENSLAIVTAGPCSRSAVLDGFIISSGNAFGPEHHQVYQHGAGLLLSVYGAPCCPSIRNCTFVGNSAYYGGAVYLIGVQPELINCTFLDNAAIEGGAIGTDTWRSLAAPDSGTCESAVRGCTFTGNYAQNTGGAINTGVGSPSIIGSTFTRNSAGTGGAIYSSGITSIANCLLIHNVADQEGGAIYSDGIRLDIISCTLSGNVAPAGTAMTCFTPFLTVTNMILWNGDGDVHRDGEIRIGAITGMNITYSNVNIWGGWPGEGNIDVDPCFVEPGYWDPNGTPDDPNDDFWVDGDYHLKSQAGRYDPSTQSWVKDDVTSPCIDAGDPMSPVGLEAFPNGGIVNMGAYSGTAEASKSYFGEPVCETIVAGDINGDCKVDFLDFVFLSFHWLEDHGP